MGLLELTKNGKARLIPVLIMDNGEFYDASIYKASPVPMALDSDTVYEGLSTGVSQGLFTVSTAGHVGDTWFGLGSWKSADEIAAAAKKKAEAPPPKAPEQDAPPRLRRPGPGEKPETSAPPATPVETVQKEKPAPKPDPVATIDAPDRPILRRNPDPAAEPQVHLSPEDDEFSPQHRKPGAVQVIPAISDSAGPDPRPYAFKMKPDEEETFRKKMLAFVSEEVRDRAAQLAANAVGAPPLKKTAAKPVPLAFADVQLRVFDLTNANEPVAIITATAKLPPAAMEYYVTIVAREDIYGELHKAYTGITDNQHLDILPRIELIDAVDADGDGRGELLFRQTSDAGTAYVLYRVIGDRLWALFQGTPVSTSHSKLAD